MAGDALDYRARADAAARRAAEQLRSLLHDLAGRIRPFPPFPGAMFVYGIEVEPPHGSDRGCVILADDGELYELRIGLDLDELSRGGDHVATREEVTTRLELPDPDYVAYAHRAVEAAADYVEREGGSDGAG